MNLSDMIQKNIDNIGKPRTTTQETTASQPSNNGGLSALLPMLIFLMNMGKGTDASGAGLLATPGVTGSPFGAVDTTMAPASTQAPLAMNYANSSPTNIMAALKLLLSLPRG